MKTEVPLLLHMQKAGFLIRQLICFFMNSLISAMEGVALSEDMISPYSGDLFHEVGLYELQSEKTFLWGFCTGLTQTDG